MEQVIAEQPEAGLDLTEETRAVARGGGLNVIGYATNALIRALITLIIGRLLGVEAVGLFYLAFAIHDLSALLIAGGFQSALARFVAIHRADDDVGRLYGVVRLGLVIPTAAGCVVGAVLLVYAQPIALNLFGEPRMTVLLQLLALTLPATVLTDVALAATQGFKTMRPYAMIGLIFEPLARLFLTGIVLATGRGVTAAFATLLITNILAAVLAMIRLRRLMPARTEKPVYMFRELFAFSALTWISILAIDLLIWSDTILLGILRGPDEVGIYQVASRLVMISAIFVIPMGLALGPRATHLHHAGRTKELAALYATVTGWIMRLAVPTSLVLILFPRPLLSVFGPDFRQGAGVTVALAFGALIHAATGPSGILLTMTGSPGLSFATNAAGLGVNLVLNLLLIPEHGAQGAAWAWLASIAVSNVIVASLIWRRLHAHAFRAPVGKAVVAGSAAVLVVVAIRATNLVDSIAVEVLALSFTYVSVLVALGFSKEEKDILRMTRDRVLAFRNEGSQSS